MELFSCWFSCWFFQNSLVRFHLAQECEYQKRCSNADKYRHNHYNEEREIFGELPFLINFVIIIGFPRNWNIDIIKSKKDYFKNFNVPFLHFKLFWAQFVLLSDRTTGHQSWNLVINFMACFCLDYFIMYIEITAIVYEE